MQTIAKGSSAAVQWSSVERLEAQVDKERADYLLGGLIVAGHKSATGLDRKRRGDTEVSPRLAPVA